MAPAPALIVTEPPTPPFDPLAGGFPVPPMPGQVMPDPRPAIAATVTVGAPVTGGDDPADDASEEVPGV